MPISQEVEGYQLRVYLRKVSPMIWRRLLVRSDSTIAELHNALQSLMEWHDVHLHHFLIRGKQYGIAQIGTWGFMDRADSVQLGQLNLRLNETFTYEYNYYDEWRLIIRLEQRLPLVPGSQYPRCTGGKRSGPPDDCGGAWRFMQLKQHFSLYYIEDRLMTILADPDLEETRWDYADELRQLLYWLNVDRFDRREANRRLQELSRQKESIGLEEEFAR